jgi:hypothetical protein
MDPTVSSPNPAPGPQNIPNPQPTSSQPVRVVAQNTPPAPTNPQQRPVAPWPPAGTPAAAELNSPKPDIKPIPGTKELETIGTEVAESAGAIAPASTPKPTPISDFRPTTPTAQNATQPVQMAPPQPLMSKSQADMLFTEDSKPKKSGFKFKKTLITSLIILLTLALGAAAYIFFYGSQQAQSYKNSSSFGKYQEAFAQIKLSLEKTPVDSAEFKSGVNKLKIANENPGKLSTVYFGNLNPNYKKAKEAKAIEVEYQKQAEQYFSTYGAYPELVSVLSRSFHTISEIQDLSELDLSAITAENAATEFNQLLESCKQSIASIESSSKPADLSNGSKILQEKLSGLCSGDAGSIQSGPLVILAGKTGTLTPEDQAAVKAQLEGISASASKVNNAEGENNFEFNKLTSYHRSSVEIANKMLQEVEVILSS